MFEYAKLKLTPSQQQLLQLAQRPVRSTTVEIVKIHQSFSGVTSVARLADRQSAVDRKLPRSIRLLSCKGWDVAMEMVKLAGLGSYGYGHLDTMRRCLRKITEKDERGLVLWFDRAGRMPPWEQEDLEARLETISHDIGIPMRLVFLIQKTLVWDNAAQRRSRAWMISETLLRRAGEDGQWDFTADGFEHTELSDDAFETPRRMAVAG